MFKVCLDWRRLRCTAKENLGGVWTSKPQIHPFSPKSSRKSFFSSSLCSWSCLGSETGYWMETTCLIQSCMGASLELAPGAWKQGELQITNHQQKPRHEANQSSRKTQASNSQDTQVPGTEPKMKGGAAEFKSPVTTCVYEKSQGCCEKQKSQ